MDMTLRPKFHITGGEGWINDPNGLVLFGGRYHAFFQYHPYSNQWGPMHWGHVVSDDLTHWQPLPIALVPGDEGDRDGCFSGSAIVHDGKLWLLYTGATIRRPYEATGGDRQVQCLASSVDGIHFEKHGVVIGEDILPHDYSIADFRDPQVWRSGNRFWCVVGARKKEGKGRVLLFSSENLFDWRFEADILRESRGTMYECPNFSERLGVLTVSEQYQPAEGKVHLNLHTTRYFVGNIDYDKLSFNATSEGICDYGFDFYAPQFFDGEDIAIGWLNMWERDNPTSELGFAGMLTVPRRLYVEDGELKQQPILCVRKQFEREVHGSVEDNIKVGMIKICAENLTSLKLEMRKDASGAATLTFDGARWLFDRSKCGRPISGSETDEDSLAGIRSMPCDGNAHTELLVVFDEFSIEIFANGRALSSTVYPSPTADGLLLSLTADSATYSHFAVL